MGWQTSWRHSARTPNTEMAFSFILCTCLHDRSTERKRDCITVAICIKILVDKWKLHFKLSSLQDISSGLTLPTPLSLSHLRSPNIYNYLHGFHEHPSLKFVGLLKKKDLFWPMKSKSHQLYVFSYHCLLFYPHSA